MDEVLKRLETLERLIISQSIIRKEVLNLQETCQFLELSPSHLYKLTSTGGIPYYKPNGKKLYFKRAELETWLLRNRSCSRDEIERQAADYIITNGRSRR